MRPYLVSDRPLAFGHRGAAATVPENTLASFEAALAAGVDGLEIDIHPTADGTPVVIHDDTVNRTTDGHGRVSSLSLAALRELDAGYRFSADGGGVHPFRGKGLTIPTFEETLALSDRIRLNVDVKETNPVMEERLADLIDRFGARDRVLLCSFSADRTWRIRRRFPYLASTACQTETTWFVVMGWLGLASTVVPKADCFQIPPFHRGIPVLTRRLIDGAHGAGLKVHVWTVNDPAEMARYLEWGVDGLVSDCPEVLVRVVRDVTAGLARAPGSPESAR